VLRQGRNATAQVPCDPLDVGAFQSVLEQHLPLVIINLVAMTDVDLCEREPARAFEANVRVVESIARAVGPGSKAGRVHLIQISTDQVYDGPGPHHEEDTRPPNVYGTTKYEGELVAQGIGATVLRTNFVGRSSSLNRRSLSDWIVDSLRTAQPITVFDNIRFSPLHVTTLCQCIEQAVSVRTPGVFNLGAINGISKAEFARSMASQLRLDTASMQSGPYVEMPQKARRPLDMTMVVEKYQRAFGVPLPRIEDEVQLVVKEYL
jgi:dTDP-4-dehydrorhamnose reductase